MSISWYISKRSLLISLVLFSLPSCGSLAYEIPSSEPTSSEVEVSSTHTSVPAATPESNISTPEFVESSEMTLLPGLLDCSIIEGTGRGSSWNQLIVGLSTREEVEAHLDSAHSFVSPHTGNLIFENADSSPQAEWVWIEVCFDRQDLLTALNIHGTKDFPIALEDWLDTYHQPDRVTWGDQYFTRSLIWAEEGILAVVNVDTERTQNIVLFTPIPRTELDNSWLISSLPKSGQVYRGDEDPLPPEKEIEDPWEIERSR